ncbi:MAG TPA: zinc-ribbon domain-containing protein, partial [Blastocatellia bacterium]|nr:zinc-ribbon domain-containing protein [Blastocatellia bacterium]
MFCPNCGTNNNPEQKYCRQCGQHLAATRIALEGGFDHALDKLKKGENAVSSGVVTFAIFFCIAVI